MTEARPAVEAEVLGHFATYRFTSRFWSLEPPERRVRARDWFDAVKATSEATRLYLVQGLEVGADVLVWSAARLSAPEAVGAFFRARAAAENSHRAVIEPVHLLWGITRPSEYSRAARSAQEIDPFAAERARYLIMYPFTKTAEWYLLGRDTRQGMMNEHIRVGKEYREITQLLLYSFGLQDQEFVVVYEADDLSRFSKLVYDLRTTEARRYTKSDTPLHAGVRISEDEWVESMG
jgi:chlorite dismutase